MACKYCIERGKTWNGDDPICAFDDKGNFVKENWNCATLSIIREYAVENNLDIYDSDNRALMISNGDGLFLGLFWYKRRGKVDKLFNINSSYSDFRLCDSIIKNIKKNKRYQNIK